MSGERLTRTTRPRATWGALRHFVSQRESPWPQSGGPHNPLASLSAARFRVGAQLRWGPHRGQEAAANEAASSENFVMLDPMPATERLLLRRFTAADREPFAAL